MRRKSAEFGVVLSVVTLGMSLVACTEAVNFGTVQTPVAECPHARAILTTSSPFHSALAQWAAAPAGTKSALDALDFACDAAGESSRGTEHGACTLLALIYSSGEGVPKDPSLAFRYLSRARGCGNMGFNANDMSHTEEHALYEGFAACCAGIGCARGCETACAEAIDRVTHELLPPLEKACTAGRGTACYLLAYLHYGEYIAQVGSVTASMLPEEERLATTKKLMERSCDRGVGPACDYVDRQEAACNAGWADGCLDVGSKIEEKRGRLAAIPYYERACALGQHRVCNQVGEMFEHGDKIPVDHDRAVKNYANAWR